MVANDLTSEDDILKAIDDGAAQIGLTLSDEEKDSILSVMKKISSLDLDVDALKEQASGIYDRLKELGVDMSSWDKDSVIDAITGFFSGIIDFFTGLFSA